MASKVNKLLFTDKQNDPPYIERVKKVPQTDKIKQHIFLDFLLAKQIKNVCCVVKKNCICNSVFNNGSFFLLTCVVTK